MDIGATVLHMLMEEQSLDGWSRVKKDFFEESYSSLYSSIHRFYQEYNRIPSFDQLDTVTRDIKTQKDLAALRLLEVPEIELDLAIDALIDQYSQNESLNLLDRYIDKITVMDSLEVKESLSHIVMKLDEQTHTDEKVSSMGDLLIFQEPVSYTHLTLPTNREV